MHSLTVLVKRLLSCQSTTNTWKVFLDLGNLHFIQLQFLETLIDGNKTEKLKTREKKLAVDNFLTIDIILPAASTNGFS